VSVQDIEKKVGTCRGIEEASKRGWGYPINFPTLESGGGGGFLKKARGCLKKKEMLKRERVAEKKNKNPFRAGDRTRSGPAPGEPVVRQAKSTFRTKQE